MQTARLTAPLLGLLLLFALLVREGPRPQEGVDARPAVETFLAAEGAWNLRRVQLTLAAGRVPQFDRAARFPAGGDVVDPPVFPAVLSGGAYLALDGATGGPGGRELDEERLAGILRHVGPLLGVLLVLVAYRAAARLGGLAARARSLGAAAQLAIGAPFVLALEAGRLPLGAWTALFSALGVSMAVPLLRPEGELLDRLQSALLAGLVLGLALAGSPLAAAAVVPLVALLLANLFQAADGEARRARAREALLLMVSLACIAGLPALGGPWQRPEHDAPVGWLARHIPLFVLAAGLPACLAFWPPIARRLESRGLTHRAGIVALVVSAIAVLAFLPELPAPRLFVWPAAWGLLYVIAFACCLRDRPGSALRAWCCILPVAWAVSLLDERGALFAGLAGSVVVVGAVWPDGRATRRWLLAALATVLVADLAGTWLARQSTEARRSGDAVVVRALRELRHTTTSAGPWNATRAVVAWCVAAPPALAPAVLLHARRPVLDSGGRVTGGADHERERRLWEADSAEALTAAARELGVGALCLRPQDLTPLESAAEGELPFLRALLDPGDLGLQRERIGPLNENGRPALVIVRFGGDSAPDSAGSAR